MTMGEPLRRTSIEVDGGDKLTKSSCPPPSKVPAPQMMSPQDEGPGPSVKYVGALRTIAAARPHPVPKHSEWSHRKANELATVQDRRPDRDEL
jgi:hypothetical protein